MISVLGVSLPGDVDIDDFLRTHSELHVESVRRAGDVGRLVRVADTSGFNATIASGGRFSDLLVRTIALLERMQPALGYARSVGAISSKSISDSKSVLAVRKLERETG